jgi:hypothetical protein
MRTAPTIRTLEQLRLEIEKIAFELDQHQRQLAIKDKLAVAVLYAAEQACHLVREMINRALAAQYTREGNA